MKFQSEFWHGEFRGSSACGVWSNNSFGRVVQKLIRGMVARLAGAGWPIGHL